VREWKEGEGTAREAGNEGGRQGQVERLNAKFHLNVFIVSASGGQNHNFGHILTFGGSWADLLLPMRAKLVCHSRPMVYVYMPDFVSIRL